MAGTVVTPIPEYSAATPTAEYSAEAVTFSYAVEEREQGPHPNLVFIDTVPLFGEMKDSHPELYASMFTSTAEQSDAAYALWEQFFLYVLRQKLRPTDVRLTNERVELRHNDVEMKSPEGVEKRNQVVGIIPGLVPER